MKCLYDGKEFTPKRSTAKFCSAKCKLDYNRQKTKLKGSKAEFVESIPMTALPALVETEGIDYILDKDALYEAIRGYRRDTWVTSPEYAELIRRLKVMSLKDLQEAGYYIPVWKLNGKPAPEERV